MVLSALLVTKDTFQKQFNVSEGEGTDGISSRRWENNIKVDLKVILMEERGMDWSGSG
jgi:hypothetical protein